MAVISEMKRENLKFSDESKTLFFKQPLPLHIQINVGKCARQDCFAVQVIRETNVVVVVVALVALVAAAAGVAAAAAAA